MGNKEVKMSLYEINKELVKQLPALTEEECMTKIFEYFNEYGNSVPAHHMLLSTESRDYTVFEFKSEINKETIGKGMVEVYDILSSRGEIKAMDLQEDGSLDIWVNETFYKLFDYSLGIILI